MIGEYVSDKKALKCAKRGANSVARFQDWEIKRSGLAFLPTIYAELIVDSIRLYWGNGLQMQPFTFAFI